jgi:hypothetical protein
MSFGTEVTRAVGASRLHGICLVWCPATFPDDLRTPSQTSANLTPGRPVVVEVAVTSVPSVVDGSSGVRQRVVSMSFTEGGDSLSVGEETSGHLSGSVSGDISTDALRTARRDGRRAEW